MDCEKFDRVALDLLYAELDELTAASAKRHTEHCTRCRAILSELRATREVGAVPLVDPPDGLELRILEAERQARKGLPVRQRVGRVISLLAGYAMRPQLAMAALLLLLIGSSLVVLRGRPGDRDSVIVTEQGLPASESEHQLLLPERLPSEVAPAPEALTAEAKAKAAPAASVAAAEPADAEEERSGDDAEYSQGVALYDQGRYVEARRVLDSVATKGGPRAAESALYAARATQQTQGCGAAVTQFEQVSARFRNTPSGLEANWQAADCYRTLGETEQARRSYEALLSTDYDERARGALARLADEAGDNAVASRKARAVAKPEAKADEAPATGAPAKAKPAPAKASKSGASSF
jgi:tetratricopeptide (TPR) repeat protein